MPRSSDEEDEMRKSSRTPYDVQRMKLEKLLKNIDKPAPIPPGPREYKPPAPPEFVRNVVGSSAGAGSGEYHIYRNLRKREYARQEFYAAELKRDALDKEYNDRVDAKKRVEEEKLAKRRAKRLKQKQRAKKAKTTAAAEEEDESSEEEENDEEPADAKKTDEAAPS